MASKAQKLAFLASNSPIDILLPVFQPIQPSTAGKVTYQIPVPTNWCYLFFSLMFTGAAGFNPVTCLQELRVKVNGILLMQLSGSNLDAINQYLKYPASTATGSATTFISIVPFLRQNMKGQNGWIDFQASDFNTGSIPDIEWETLLNCGSMDPQTGMAITQVILELDMVNTPAGTLAVTPTAKVLPSSPGGPGALMFWNKTTFTASNSNANQLTGQNGLLYGDVNHAYLDSLFMFPPAGLIDNYQFWLNSQEIFQRTQLQNIYWQTLNFFRVPPAVAGGAMCVIDFCENGFADGVKFIAPLATACRLQFSENTAEGVVIIQRSLGYLG